MDLLGQSSRWPALARLRAFEASQQDQNSLPARLRTWLQGALWNLKPPRLHGLPGTLALLGKYYAGLGPRRGELPDPRQALRHPDGLAGICTTLSVATLKSAYAKGLYPFAHIGPQKWWSPKERMVLFIEDFHIERNLRRRLKQKEFSVSFDRDFDAAHLDPGRHHRGLYTRSSRGDGAFGGGLG